MPKYQQAQTSKSNSRTLSRVPPGLSRHENGGARPLAVTVKKACELIGVGNTTMYELVRDGRVKTTTIEHAEADAPDHSPNSRPGSGGRTLGLLVRRRRASRHSRPRDEWW